MPMRFESFLWVVLSLLLAQVTVWNDNPTFQPEQTEEQFEAKDGGSTMPPTGP
jgi:hypothetical protein